MAQVPQYKRQVTPENTPTPYHHVETNGAMFGENVAAAKGKLAETAQHNFDNMIKIKDTIDTAHIIEVANLSEDWEQKNLYDTENGYFYKLGKDAAGKAQEVLSAYDKAMQSQIQKYGLTPANQLRAKDILRRKRERIAYSVNAHDFRQTQEYAKNELETGLTNSLNSAYNGRNDDKLIQTQIANGMQMIDLSAKLSHADEATVKLQKQAYLSKVHENVIRGMLADNNILAEQYLEKHKSEINPSVLPNLTEAVKKNSLDYTARNTASGLINLSTADAYNYINSITDPTQRNAVESEYTRQLNQKEKIQREIDTQQGNNYMQQLFQAHEQGVPTTDIMSGILSSDLSFETKKELMQREKDMNEMDNYANGWADKNYLLDLATFDNEKFLQTDLFRFNLSKDDYNKFLEMQRKGSNVQYSTDVELHKAIKQFDTSFNMQGKEGLHSSEYEQALVSMLAMIERKQGAAFDLKHMDQGSINALVQGFNYKNPDEKNKNIDEVKELFARAKKHGDIESYCANSIMSFRQRNKREPNEQEIYEIVKKGYNTIETQYKNQSYDKVQYVTYINNSVNNTKQKSGETKVLTYFADTQVPQISRKLGLKLTMVDGARYRKGDNGGHGKGYKCDISTSEHNANDVKNILQEIYALPNVKYIGTSDPLILKNFPPAINKKVKDLREYDRLHGTNHTHHFDIVLDTGFGGTQQGAVVNVANKTNGNKTSANNKQTITVKKASSKLEDNTNPYKGYRAINL